jgi:hypothetical protein
MRALARHRIDVTRGTMRIRWSGRLAATFLLVGCSGAGGRAETSRAAGPSPTYGGEIAFEDELAAAPSVEREAQFVGAPQVAPGGAPASSPASSSAADAAPLLVYTAHLAMSVYRVDEVREGVITAVRELGGVMTLESAAQVTVRVPAARFQEALDRVEELGEVVSRNVRAQDVGEEFRDIGIRIETLEAMRRRVERLLEQAQDVQAALEVERHLERITVELERLKGRQRFLADQVALSTITVTFQERQVEDIARGIFKLPFDWIRQIGLTSLMRLR